MAKIKIKHFGTLKEGYEENDGWIELKKVMVFIGNQGSGKSTVTKLISTLVWIEKAIVRGIIDEKKLSKISINWFKKRCSYQNIDNYFKKNTEIYYVGVSYTLYYVNETIQISYQKNAHYLVPKIMYVPAERNFVSAVSNVRDLKGLPSTLYTFSDEFIDAAERLRDKSIQLPINGATFEYQRLNKIAWIGGEDYKIRLSEASSGFQSLVPLFLVTKYLAESIVAEDDKTEVSISLEEKRRIEKEVADIMSNNALSPQLKEVALAFLSNKFTNSCFINIVEEPEQNLFPTSQKIVLNVLLEYVNLTVGNQLIMTTHSPYLINYLTLAVKANELYNISNIDKNKLQEIVPFVSTIGANDLTIYELEESKGTIKMLETYQGLPSDENDLNNMLGESNELFAQLLEIQQTS